MAYSTLLILQKRSPRRKKDEREMLQLEKYNRMEEVDGRIIVKRVDFKTSKEFNREPQKITKKILSVKTKNTKVSYFGKIMGVKRVKVSLEKLEQIG